VGKSNDASTRILESSCLDLATMTLPLPHEINPDRAPLHRKLVVSEVTAHYWEYPPLIGTVDRAGDVPPLVFVHGFRGDHHGFEAIVAELPELRIIVPDLPGFGESDPFSLGGSVNHDIDGYAAWLRNFVTQLDLASPPIIVGHSFGSIIGSAAVAQGMRTAGTILINPVAPLSRSGTRRFVTNLIAFYHWLGSVLPDRLGVALLRNRLIIRMVSETMATTKRPELRSWIHAQHDRYFGAFANPAVVRQAFRALNDRNVAHYAPLVSTRVLLITAEKDGVTNVREQYLLASLFSSATLQVLPRVGHLTHYEAPAETAELISQFAMANVNDGGTHKR
jgi:pimeloyl-ACP methyl ester carboxylesterase